MTEKTADVVLRSEARLVRSVNGFPFTASMTAVQSAELLDRVSFAAEGTRFALFPLSELPPQERALLVENRFYLLRRCGWNARTQPSCLIRSAR